MSEAATTTVINELISACRELDQKKSIELEECAQRLASVAETEYQKLLSLLWLAKAKMFAADYTETDKLLFQLQAKVSDFPEISSEIFNALAWNSYYKGDYKSIKKYCLKGLDAARKINYEKGVADNLSFLGYFYKLSGQLKKALIYYRESLKVREAIKDINGIAGSYNNLGIAYASSGKYSEALSYLQQAAELRMQLSDPHGLASTYNNIALVYSALGNYKTSLSFHFKSLEIKLKINDKYGSASSYNNIAVIYEIQEDYDESLRYYKKSLALKQIIKDAEGLAVGYANIAMVYDRKNKFETALKFYLKAFKAHEKNNTPVSLATTSFRLIEIYLKLNKLKEAEYYASVGFSFSQKIQNVEVREYHYKTKSLIESYKKNYPKAIRYLKTWLKEAQKLGREYGEREFMLLLSRNFQKAGDEKNALKYFELFHEKDKKIFNAENAKYIASLEYLAEIDRHKKEAEIEKLRNVELKQAYESLKEAQDELIRKEKMAAIGKIASEIAHEIQNPLNFVNNFSEINMELFDELNEAISMIEAAPHLSEVLADLNNNSKSINVNGKRVAGIVSRLIELTRSGDFVAG